MQYINETYTGTSYIYVYMYMYIYVYIYDRIYIYIYIYIYINLSSCIIIMATICIFESYLNYVTLRGMLVQLNGRHS